MSVTHTPGRRVLVTGGCGLVGSRIVRLLAETGDRVRVLDTMDAYDFDYVTEFGAARYAERVVRGSVADPEAAAAAVEGCDAVVHAAAYADVAGCYFHPSADFDANVHGTQVMLEAARAAGTRRFVFVSSASVYGSPSWPDPGTPPRFAEDDRTSAISTYANSKLWGETQAALYDELYDLPVTVLRYFSVYGEPQVPKRLSHSWCVAWFGMRLAAGRPCELHGGGHQVRDFVHVDDIAAATVAALDRDEARGRVVNVGTGVPTTVRTVAELVGAHFPDARLVETPRRAGDPMGGYADTRAVREVLDWKPAVDLPSGVERYARWLTDNRRLVPSWVLS